MSAFWDKIKGKKDQKEAEKASDGVATESKASKKQDSVKPAEEEKKSPKTAKKGRSKEKKARKKVMSQIEAKLAGRVLLSPKISEASMNQQAIGKYVFKVVSGANKNEIAKAIEAFYGVNVEKVNILNYSSKRKNFRGVAGAVKGFKKAIVTLRSGQSIDMFKEAK